MAPDGCGLEALAALNRARAVTWVMAGVIEKL